jgi:NADH-quinone oxidoreductase subunit N
MDSIILKSFLPEIFLSLAILLQLVFNARLINNLSFNFPIIDKEIFGQTLFILFCLFCLFLNLKVEGFFSNFIFINDEGGRVVKILFTLSCALVLITILRSFSLQKLNFFEFFTLFLLSILALLLLVSVYDLISAYLIIEMQALCFYVLASFRRTSAFSTESGLKYFVSGSFISCVFLFGCSLIYGGLGTLNFNELNLLLSFPFDENYTYINYFVIIGILFVTITLLFKISAAPFHFWAPDVYEGSPLSTTVIFSILPKLIIFSFFIRWISAISLAFYDIKFILIATGLCSVFVGTFFALQQKRLKRLIIYSSIAQVGFLVMALSTQSVDGFASIFFFLILYIITSILVWSHITLFQTFQTRSNLFYNKISTPLFLTSLSNIFKTNPVWAISFVIIFFSIAGVPPLSGFLSKIFILFGLVQAKEVFEATALILISAVSVFYYIRVIKTVFFESKDVKSNNMQIQTIFKPEMFEFDSSIIAFCLFLLIFIFFYPTLLLLICQYIVLSFFGF